MRKLIITFSLATSLLFVGNQQADASTVHSVKSGDTLWLLANHYGVSVNAKQQTIKQETLFSSVNV
jgi:N-acetylmuramoyl-L-alanine amidase